MTMALSTRIKSLERASARVCSVCHDKTEATLRIVHKIVKTPSECTPSQPVPSPSECPACGRKIRITKIVDVPSESS
jgi:hypothetical protein